MLKESARDDSSQALSTYHMPDPGRNELDLIFTVRVGGPSSSLRLGVGLSQAGRLGDLMLHPAGPPKSKGDVESEAWGLNQCSHGYDGYDVVSPKSL